MLTCEKPPRMMRLGGIPFFISCSMIALTGSRGEKWVSGRGKGLKSTTQHLRVHPEIQRSQGKGLLGSQDSTNKGEVEQDTCSSPSEGEAHSSSPLPPPLTELLTVFCSFLNPSFILGCIWSQSHQVKPGGSSGVSQNLSQHPKCGEAGAGCALPFLAPTGQWVLSPIPLTPQKGPTQPCPLKH